MADEVGTVFVKVKPTTDGLSADIDKQVSESKGALSDTGKKIGLAVGAGFAAYKAFDIGKSAFAAAEESQKVAAQTEAVIKSTGGAAGVTAKQIDALAGSISKKTGIDDEAIASGANLLLTFTNVKNVAGDGAKVFDRATGLLADMGTAMGTDASGSAIQLGKALNDPVKGISALSRVGVTFTDEQKTMIESMVAANDVAGAQTIILDELAKEFGGSAEAQATSADKAKVAMGNLTEQVGALLVPAVSFLADVLTNTVIPAISGAVDWFDKHKAVAVLLGGALGVVAAALLIHKAYTLGAAAAEQVHAVATGAVTAAQWLWNAALTANPIGIVVLAIGALVAGIVIAYNKVDWFRGGINKLWGAIQTAYHWVADNWPLILAILTGPFGIAVKVIADNWDSIVGFITDMPGRIATAARGMWDGIKEAFKTVVNAIIRFWNGLEFKVPGFDAGPIHIGGQTIGVPDIPLMAAAGAYVDRPTLTIAGEAYRPEIISPVPTMYSTMVRAIEDTVKSGTSSSTPLVSGDLVLQGNGGDTAIEELERWWWSKTAGIGGRAA